MLGRQSNEVEASNFVAGHEDGLSLSLPLHVYAKGCFMRDVLLAFWKIAIWRCRDCNVCFECCGCVLASKVWIKVNHFLRVLCQPLTSVSMQLMSDQLLFQTKATAFQIVMLYCCTKLINPCIFNAEFSCVLSMLFSRTKFYSIAHFWDDFVTLLRTLCTALCCVLA